MMNRKTYMLVFQLVIVFLSAVATTFWYDWKLIVIIFGFLWAHNIEKHSI